MSTTVSTVIDTVTGVVSALSDTPTVTFGSDTTVSFSGSVDFSAASVTGVTVDPNVAETDDPSISSPETYDCAGGVRTIKVGSFGGNWTIAALTNLSISDSQATVVRIVGPAQGVADRTVTLTGMTVNGSAATVSPATVKVKKDKGTGLSLNVVKSSGSYFVFGSAHTSE